MKKIFLLLTFFFFALTPLAAAAQTTPSPHPSITTPAERLKEIRDRVEERIQEVKEKSKTRAFWGTLKEISNSTLVMDTLRGERRVKTTEETKITLDKKKAELADLEIGNFLIVVATLEQNDNLTAQRILAFSKTPKPVPTRQALFGKVSEIKVADKMLVITHLKKGAIFEVRVTEKTIITKKVDEKIKKVNFKDIQVGDRIVAVASKEKEKGAFVAKLIHVIPGQSQNLTPSPAKVSPTPSPTPKPKPTSTPTPTD